MQGAIFWDWTQDGIDTAAHVPVQLELDPERFETLAAEKGISSEQPVVCYDGGDSGSIFACRVRWALRCHGHPQA
jgi:3-mercaptopyruvate sulfurtransferase SseA